MEPEMGDSVEVTFRLTPKAASALEDAALMEGLSETTALNRAVQIYQYLLMEKQLGKKLAWYQTYRKWGFLRVRKYDGFDWQ